MQTRFESLIESLTNTSIGFVFALITQLIVSELYELPLSVVQNVSITLIFTAVSILRGYLIRRFFNRRTFIKTSGEF